MFNEGAWGIERLLILHNKSLGQVDFLLISIDTFVKKKLGPE